jgi:hypothetical protein
MIRILPILTVMFLTVVLTIFEYPQSQLFRISSGQHESSEGRLVVTVEKNGHNIIAKINQKIVYNNTSATQGIQLAIDYLPDGGEVYIYNGTYYLSNPLNITENVRLRGQGSSTVLDYSNIGEAKAAIDLSKNSRLSDLELVGSLSPLPKDFTQAIRTDDNTIIENVSINKMGYGIDTAKSKNVTLSNIKCQFIQSVRDWAACIHAASTEDLMVRNFRVADSNRGLELDAATENVTVQNGEIIRVKNFNNTGHEAFSLDAHSHDGEGGVDNIIFEDIILRDSNAPSIKVASENGEYAADDLPRTVRFENITVINPVSPWQVNGEHITLKDIRIVNSTQDILTFYRNSKNILVQNVTASPIIANKCFICNTQRDLDIRNLSIINNAAFLNPDKVGPTMSFYNVEGLNITNNQIFNAPYFTETIRTQSVSDLNMIDNSISYYKKGPSVHSNLLNDEHQPLDTIDRRRIGSIFPSLEYGKSFSIGQRITERPADDSEFKEYKNQTYGITVQYPSDWRRIDWRSLPDFLSFYDASPDDDFTEIVQFYSRYQDSSDKYAEGIDIAVQNSTRGANSLSEYSDQALEYYNQYSEFQLIESSTEDIHLSDNPAYRLVFTFISDTFNLKWMEVGTVLHNKVYRIIFFAENESYDEYLPIAQQVINSFEIADEL